MKIAIIGAGKIGRILGGHWAAKGHDVVYGVRDPGALPDLHARLPAEAASAAEVIVITVPAAAAVVVVRELGPLGNKVLVDVTNAVRFGGPVVERASASPLSLAEEIQAAAPDAHVVKAFNQYGGETLAMVAKFAHSPMLAVAGDDPSAKAAAMALAVDAGFAPEDVGPLAAARLIEDFARLWMTMSLDPARGRRFSFAIQQPGETQGSIA